LSFAALVVGSTIPDLGYYVGHPALGDLAHTFLGSFLVCLPAGLGTLVVLYVLRRPLWLMLPQPHRRALAPLTRTLPLWPPERIVALALSIVLGSWTHIVWDSFTHDSGWVVANSTWLQQSVFHLGQEDVPAYFLLQQLSTFCGAVGVLVVYRSWLARQRRSDHGSSLTPGELRRYAFIVTIAIISLVIAVTRVARAKASPRTYLDLDLFIFHSAVYATAWFASTFVVGALLFYTAARERAA
jgi:hypothetical protein